MINDEYQMYALLVRRQTAAGEQSASIQFRIDRILMSIDA
jgi:hypothetical protein